MYLGHLTPATACGEFFARNAGRVSSVLVREAALLAVPWSPDAGFFAHAMVLTDDGYAVVLSMVTRWCLENGDEELLSLTAVTLSNLGADAKESVPVLKQCLAHRDASVRRWADFPLRVSDIRR